jgi:hypothetical protein
MNDAFAKDLRKREKEYVKPPLAQQIAERGARMDKRLTDWLGPLSVSQEQRVMAWSTALGDQNTQWIANRAHWQQQFSEAVAQRKSPIPTTNRDASGQSRAFVDTGLPPGLRQHRSPGAFAICGSDGRVRRSSVSGC